MALRPLRDRIVVRPIEEKLSNVIEVVELGDKRIHRGEVLAVGPKANWGTKPGDTIQFTDIFRFPRVKDGNETVLILQEADVCFVEDQGERDHFTERFSAAA